MFRLGYVAMSVHVKNSSPSQTMTYSNFTTHQDRDAAIRKLERISIKNVENCLRLLKHNNAFGIKFFRLSSRLIPLATHDELSGWNYLKNTKTKLKELGDYAKENNMRLDYHPDHFVVINSPKDELVKTSVLNLRYHYNLLKASGIDPSHRCVLHVGGSYGNKENAMERFIENWGKISTKLQKMIMLENDDKTFTSQDTLYLCEKLGVPHVFDLHHHLANHDELDWTTFWDRIVNTWSQAKLPLKMHISSPKSMSQFRHHADLVDPKMFLDFAKEVDGSVPQIDCMIEAKQKDEALFQLVRDLSKNPSIEWVTKASFRFK